MKHLLQIVVLVSRLPYGEQVGFGTAADANLPI